MLLYKTMLTVGWNKQRHPILKSHVLLIRPHSDLLLSSQDQVTLWTISYFLYYPISLKLPRRLGSDRSYRLCEFTQTTACTIVKHSLRNYEEN